MNRHRLPGHDLEVYCYRPAEADFMYEELFDRRVYLRNELTVPDGATVVDVGANIGLSAIFFCREAKDVSLIAIEPVPDLYDILQANIALHDLNARAYCC